MKDNNAVARPVFRYAFAHMRDHPRGLMPVNAGRSEQVVFDFLQIGMADAAGLDANQNLTGPNGGRVDLIH